MGVRGGGWMLEAPSVGVRPLAPGRYRLRLVPAPDEAEKTIDVEKVLADELVYDIEIK